MAKCIYCLSQSDKGKEHVIPACLGRFSLGIDNPTLRGGYVCDICNAEFGRLETIFKEDSEEGITSQMYNLNGENSVRIRGKNVDMKSSFGEKEHFLNQAFPFLELKDEEFVVEFKPQVKIHNFGGGYQVFLKDALKKIQENPNQFVKYKERFKTSGTVNIAVFGYGNSGDDSSMDELVQLLSEYGVNYREGERKFAPPEEMNSQQLNIEMQCKFTEELARVIAKIAFNYFAYCSIESGSSEILYFSEFDRIRSFIKEGNDSSWKELVRPEERGPVLQQEKSKNHIFAGHFIFFEENNGEIVCRVRLFGKFVYKILIGKKPTVLRGDNFGCGHAFNPFNNYIIALATNHPDSASEDISFGLHNKQRVANNTNKK